VKHLSAGRAITAMELSLDGKHLTAVSGRTVHFFDRNSMQLVKTHASSCELDSASLRGRSDDCPTALFVTGGADNWVHLWDFDSGKEIGLYKGHHGPVHCVRWHPTYKYFASSSDDGTIRLWMKEETVSELQAEHQTYKEERRKEDEAKKEEEVKRKKEEELKKEKKEEAKKKKEQAKAIKLAKQAEAEQAGNEQEKGGEGTKEGEAGEKAIEKVTEDGPTAEAPPLATSPSTPLSPASTPFFPSNYETNDDKPHVQ